MDSKLQKANFGLNQLTLNESESVSNDLPYLNVNVNVWSRIDQSLTFDLNLLEEITWSKLNFGHMMIYYFDLNKLIDMNSHRVNSASLNLVKETLCVVILHDLPHTDSLVMELNGAKLDFSQINGTGYILFEKEHRSKLI
jgi:hypothetical protein